MDKYKNLRYRLLEIDTWPLKYMFKFIVPNMNGKVDKIRNLLPDHGEIYFKHTPSLKHVSITCIAVMKTADQIIEITEKVSEIGDVMVL